MRTVEQADTIAAIATPVGRGAIGIIRISGSLCTRVADRLLSAMPAPRQVHVGNFYSAQGAVLDRGVAIFFQQPHSYTGEDMLELHAHGNPIVLNRLLEEIYGHGVRSAQNGEFSKRAFLNGKLDLAQAEAIADLIMAESELAVQACTRSMQGNFSGHVRRLNELLSGLRTITEASIDFPDEMSEAPNMEERRQFAALLDQCLAMVPKIQQCAQRGHQVQNSARVALIGPPNCGKSTLLNCLAERESSIVSNTPGTTRDVIRELVQMDGMNLLLIDTAGLRNAQHDEVDEVEREGIRRARQQVKEADHVLWMYDSHEQDAPPPIPFDGVSHSIIANKCDLSGVPPSIQRAKSPKGTPIIHLSASSGEGVELLRDHLKSLFETDSDDNPQVIDLFSARKRHIHLLESCSQHLGRVQTLWLGRSGAELIAEELRLAQNELEEITGGLNNEELLGKIFSQFCIGK